jgi:uncharacterized protein (TIGR03643 family)
MDEFYNKRTKTATDAIIRMAWADRCSFEQIRERTGLSESDVIKIMRRELKPGGFRRWRARVSGRVTKHRKRFKYQHRRNVQIED